MLIRRGWEPWVKGSHKPVFRQDEYRELEAWAEGMKLIQPRGDQ